MQRGLLRSLTLALTATPNPSPSRNPSLNANPNWVAQECSLRGADSNACADGRLQDAGWYDEEADENAQEAMLLRALRTVQRGEGGEQTERALEGAQRVEDNLDGPLAEGVDTSDRPVTALAEGVDTSDRPVTALAEGVDTSDRPVTAPEAAEAVAPEAADETVLEGDVRDPQGETPDETVKALIDPSSPLNPNFPWPSEPSPLCAPYLPCSTRGHTRKSRR